MDVWKFQYVTTFPRDAFCSEYNDGYNGFAFYDTSVSNYLNSNKQLSGTVRSQTAMCSTLCYFQGT